MRRRRTGTVRSRACRRASGGRRNAAGWGTARCRAKPSGQRPQRVPFENVQPRLRRVHVDAAVHERRAAETRGRLDDRHLLVRPHEDGTRGLDDDAIGRREEPPHVGEGRRIAWQPISDADVFEDAAGIWSKVAESAHGPDPDAIVVVDRQRPNRAGVVAYLNRGARRRRRTPARRRWYRSDMTPRRSCTMHQVCEPPPISSGW